MKYAIKFIGVVFLTITLAFTVIDKKTIIIDASHGGQDYGSNIDGFAEKEIALNIANKIKELNKNVNIDIILTRDSDDYLGLDERVRKINDLKPDLVISLHTNFSENKEQSGKEIYVSNQNKQKERSGNLALELFYQFEKNVEIKNADYNLLKYVEYPIALVELGYLTNEGDMKVLTSEEGQIEIAKSILKVID